MGTVLNAMLDILNERFPGGCHVFLADIYDPTDGIGDAPSVSLPDWPDGLAIHAEYNKIIHTYADERDNVHLVPLHATFLGHGLHCRQFCRNTYRGGRSRLLVLRQHRGPERSRVRCDSSNLPERISRDHERAVAYEDAIVRTVSRRPKERVLDSFSQRRAGENVVSRDSVPSYLAYDARSPA